MAKQFTFGSTPVANISEAIREHQPRKQVNTTTDAAGAELDKKNKTEVSQASSENAKSVEVEPQIPVMSAENAPESPFLAVSEPQMQEVSTLSANTKKKPSEAKKRVSRVSGVEKDVSSVVVPLLKSDYAKLTLLKLKSGQTLQSLAQQAVREFLERNPV